MTDPQRAAGARTGGVAADESARLDAELQRLAQVGAQRRDAREAAAAIATIDRRHEGYRHLRIALGAYRGSTTRRAALAITTVASVASAGIVIASRADLAIVAISLALTAIGTAWVIVPPLASEGTIADETAWVAALPFRLEGYFEVLSATPQTSRTLVYDFEYATDERPSTKLIEDVVAAVDPDARVERTPSMGVRILSGPISGMTDLKRTKTSFVTRNHRIPPSVHALVDQVLVSLHRRYPFERVSLASR